MKFLILSIILTINFPASFAGDFHQLEKKTHCLLSKLKGSNKKAGKHTKNPNHGLLSRFDCFNDKTCKTKLIRMGPGLTILQKNNPKDFQAIIKYFNGNSSNEVSPHIMSFLSDCLKVTKKTIRCSTKKFETLSKFFNYPWEHQLHPNYIKKIVKLISTEKTSHKVLKAINFAGDNLPRRKSSVKGEFNDIVQQGNHYFEPNRNFNPRANNSPKMIEIKNDMNYPKYISLQREDKAFNLLNELGFDVQIVSKDAQVRKSQGIDVQFNKLRSQDGIIDKNPDAILNDNFLVDIYSPLKPVDSETIPIIIDRILTKSESTNFKTTFLNAQSYGKRQTNRVIIYADSFNDNIEYLAKEINSQLGDQNPEHLIEAILIFRQQGKSKQITVWP